jgi:hypothetical protein
VRFWRISADCVEAAIALNALGLLHGYTILLRPSLHLSLMLALDGAPRTPNNAFRLHNFLRSHARTGYSYSDDKSTDLDTITDQTASDSF